MNFNKAFHLDKLIYLPLSVKNLDISVLYHRINSFLFKEHGNYLQCTQLWKKIMLGILLSLNTPIWQYPSPLSNHSLQQQWGKVEKMWKCVLTRELPHTHCLLHKYILWETWKFSQKRKYSCWKKKKMLKIH